MMRMTTPKVVSATWSLLFRSLGAVLLLAWSRKLCDYFLYRAQGSRSTVKGSSLIRLLEDSGEGEKERIVTTPAPSSPSDSVRSGVITVNCVFTIYNLLEY